MGNATGEDSFSDELNREDGLCRYWMYYNGQWARPSPELLPAFAAFPGGLYILGCKHTMFGRVTQALAILGFLGCWLVSRMAGLGEFIAISGGLGIMKRWHRSP